MTPLKQSTFENIVEIGKNYQKSKFFFSHIVSLYHNLKYKLTFFFFFSNSQSRQIKKKLRHLENLFWCVHHRKYRGKKGNLSLFSFCAISLFTRMFSRCLLQKVNKKLLYSQKRDKYTRKFILTAYGNYFDIDHRSVLVMMTFQRVIHYFNQ